MRPGHVLFNADTWRPEDCNGLIVKDKLQSTLATEPQVFREVDSWVPYMQRTRNQGELPSCAGHAFADAIQSLYARYAPGIIPPHHTISGVEIWKMGRLLYYNGTRSGGLTMEQAIETVWELELLPPDTEFIRFEPTVNNLCTYLPESPVIQGTSVWEGWRTPRADNGWVGWEEGGSMGGHATTVYQIDCVGKTWSSVLRNWWRDDWGWHGFGCLALGGQWERSQLTQPCAIRVDPEALRHWRGWEQWTEIV